MKCFYIFLVYTLTAFSSYAQCTCDRLNESLFTDAVAYSQWYNRNSGFIIVNSNRNSDMYDILFQKSDWKCTDSLKVELIDISTADMISNGEVVYSKTHAYRDLRYLYITNFSELEDRLVIRINLQSLDKLLVDEDPDKLYKLKVTSFNAYGENKLVYGNVGDKVFKFRKQ